ncbi:MAG: methyltransferase [Acutalibacteraceae bacterium]|nr:methyltransferase [Acutalibacteraceae bacterium]
MAEFRKEYLGSGVNVVVSDEHSFGTDAVLLADFTSPKRKENACDFGTGCGIIPMLWYRNGCGKRIWGVELQKQGYEQACESAKISSAEEKVTFLNHDLRDIKSVFEHGVMDVVSMNPPYKAADSGIKSTAEAELIARHEVECKLADVTAAAAHLLNFGGRLCMCNRPERLSDTIVAMKEAGIEPKRLRFVVKRPDTRPWLFLIEGKKGSKPYLNVEPMLVMYDDNGELSQEVIEIYGEYKENVK